MWRLRQWAEPGKIRMKLGKGCLRNDGGAGIGKRLRCKNWEVISVGMAGKTCEGCSAA